MIMDRRKFLGVLGLAGVAAAIPLGSGMALGQAADPDESTVTYLQDGSISIVGHIRYNKSFKDYVVQALVPQGVHGQYLIANSNQKVLKGLSKKKAPVVVNGMPTGEALLLQVQTVNGKAYK
jgi:hypothetical protein